MADQKLRFLLQLHDDVDLVASEKGLKNISGQIDDVEDKGKNSGKNWFDGVDSKVPKVSSSLAALGAVAAGVFSVSAIADYISELSALEGQYAKLRGSIALMGETSQSQIDQSATKLTALSATYEKDQQELFQSATSLSKAWGLSMNESLDLIEKGFMSGSDMSGEFLAQLREYPKLMREAGLEQEQFIALTARQARMGVYDDKGIDAIKEGLLALREMTKPTRDALTGLGLDADVLSKKYGNDFVGMMEEVSAAMERHQGDQQVMGAALADIWKGAGEDAGLDFILSLKDMDGSLDELIDTGNEYVRWQQSTLDLETRLAEAQNRLTHATDGGATSITKIWKETKIWALELNTLVTSSGKMFDAITGDMAGMSDEAKNNREVFRDWADQLSRVLGVANDLPKAFANIEDATAQVNTVLDRAVEKSGGKSSRLAMVGKLEATLTEKQNALYARGDFKSKQEGDRLRFAINAAQMERESLIKNSTGGKAARAGLFIPGTESTTGGGNLGALTSSNTSSTGINKLTAQAQQQRSVITTFNAPVFGQGAFNINATDISGAAPDIMAAFEQFWWKMVNNTEQTL